MPSSSQRLSSVAKWSDLVVFGSKFGPFWANGPNLVQFCTSKYYLEVSNDDKKHGTK